MFLRMFVLLAVPTAAMSVSGSAELRAQSARLIDSGFSEARHFNGIDWAAPAALKMLVGASAKLGVRQADRARKPLDLRRLSMSDFGDVEASH